MRGKIGRLIVVAAFLLLFFGFYGTDKIVQAKPGGTTKSDGDWTVFGTDMYSNVSGNIGIGDSDPDGKLEVNPDEIEDNGDEFVIDGNGNVGIGTTSPEAPFHVVASVTWPILPLLSDNSADNVNGAGIIMRKSRGNPSSKIVVNDGDTLGAVHFFGYDGSDYRNASNIRGAVDGTPSSGNIPGRIGFFTSEGTGAQERMRIDNSGNIGIGTLSPNTLLSIGGTSNFSPVPGQKVDIVSSSSLSIPLRLINQNATIGDATRSSFMFRDSGGQDYVGAYVEGKTTDTTDGSEDGQIGFGTMNNGSFVGLKMIIENDGEVRGTFGDYHVASDIRLKKEVVTIPDAIQKVSQLRGVNFRWKDDSDNGPIRMGMIAQEVEKVVPEVVHTTDDGMKTKAIEYQYLVGLLVEAIKEQQQEITALKAGNETAKRDNTALKAENEQLKGKLIAVESRLDDLEGLYLAISTGLTKEKLVKYNQAGLDEVQKTIQ